MLALWSCELRWRGVLGVAGGMGLAGESHGCRRRI